MAARGQITGAKVDGPLAFAKAISPEAARTKGIFSPVAGQADVLPPLPFIRIICVDPMIASEAARTIVQLSQRYGGP